MLMWSSVLVKNEYWMESKHSIRLILPAQQKKTKKKKLQQQFSLLALEGSIAADEPQHANTHQHTPYPLCVPAFDSFKTPLNGDRV